MGECIFDKAWIGRCKKPTKKGKICEEHKGIKCCVCGKQATRECDHTGMLVCGAPLCDDCETGYTNSGGHIHKRKEKKRTVMPTVNWEKPIKCRNGAYAEYAQELGDVVMVKIGKDKTPILVKKNGCFNEDESEDDCDIINDGFPPRAIVALHKRKDGSFFVTGPYSEDDIINVTDGSEIVAYSNAEFDEA